MQQEKCGNVIKEVIFLKNDVSIIFDDGTKIKISNNTFAHFYLYKGKKLEISEIEEIKQENELSKIKNYVLGLFAKKMYSEEEIKGKLKAKKCTKKVIERIITYLKEYHFINDDKYVTFLLEEYEMKNYGKRKIIANLKQKGISDLSISKINFDEEQELLKAKIVIKGYCLSNANKSYRSLKENGYAYLMNKGFESEITQKALKDIDDYVNKEDDRDILLKSLEKYVIIHQVDLLNPDQKNKLIKRYLAKGFDYNDISGCITEVLWKN